MMIRRGVILLLTGLVLSAEAFAQDFLTKVPEIRDLITGTVLPREEVGHAPGLFGQWSATLFDSPQTVSFVRLRPEVFGVDILCAEGEEADSTSALCQRFGAIAGINGSYFDMKELTSLAGIIGLTDALNLDGGGSSTLWVQSAGVLNHPSDNKTFDHFGQRIVPNVIAIRK